MEIAGGVTVHVLHRCEPGWQRAWAFQALSSAATARLVITLDVVVLHNDKIGGLDQDHLESNRHSAAKERDVVILDDEHPVGCCTRGVDVDLTSCTRI